MFGLTWSANVGSAAAVYALARRYGRDFFRGRLGRALLSEASLAHIGRAYEKYGTVGIFVSRLLPVWRVVVPPFAGISGVPAWRVLVPLGLASALWYGGLTYLVATLGTNLDTVLAALHHLNVALAVVAVLGLIAAGVLLRRRLRQ